MRARAWGASVCLIGTEEQEEDIFAQSPRAKAQTEALPWFAPPILEDQKSVVKEEKLNAFKLKLDPAQALASIPEQIRDSLAAGYGRYSDLFRAMDGDESGTISRREFVCAMSLLGLPQSKRQLGLIFDAFDLDESGELTYDELAKIIGKGEKLVMRSPRRSRIVPPNARKKFASALDGGLTPYDLAPPVWDPYTPVELSAPGLPPLAAWEYVLPSSYQGLNRGSGQLALVSLCSDGLGVRLATPAGPLHTHFPAGVLKSELVLKGLIAKGFSILAFESHSPADKWTAAKGEAHAAYLMAALDHIASHRALRYCRPSLFAQGVGASATLVAVSRAPVAFEQRVKAMVFSELVPVEGLLERCVPVCRVPTLLVTNGRDVAGNDLARAIQTAMDIHDTPCELVDGGAADATIDAVDFLSEHPSLMTSFLNANGGVGRDTIIPQVSSPRSVKASPRRLYVPRDGSKLPPIA